MTFGSSGSLHWNVDIYRAGTWNELDAFRRIEQQWKARQGDETNMHKALHACTIMYSSPTLLRSPFRPRSPKATPADQAAPSRHRAVIILLNDFRSFGTEQKPCVTGIHALSNAMQGPRRPRALA